MFVRPGARVRLLAAMMATASCGSKRDQSAIDERMHRPDSAADADSAENDDVPAYTGHGPEGIPNYARRAFSAADRALLRTVYGVEDPNRLYVSDSTEDGLLKYDTRVKTCATCYVNSYRVGFMSVRRPGETWEEVERRVQSTPLRSFPTAAHPASRSTADLDPAIRGDVEQMLADARRAGFVFRISATYRSAEREAYLMAEGRGRTHTLTSLHSYGRAIDIVVADGRLPHAATKASWIAFRHWVSAYRGREFRIIGTPERTWDWPHVEVPSAGIGFRTIEDALARARMCSDTAGTPAPCDFRPHHGQSN